MSIPMPPPPPPPSAGILRPPPPTIKLQGQKNLENSSDNRAALLEDIAKGVKLKKCITNERKNLQFLDGNNNNDPSSSASDSKNDVKCGPFPSALHAELTNTLKKRKTSAIDVEATKSGIRTFDPNILNTHVPQPTGFKITHATPNFTVTKKSPEMTKKSEERVIVVEKPPIRSVPSSKESSPKPISVDVVDKSAPEKVSPIVKRVQRQFSVSEDREEEPKESKKQISMTFQEEKAPEMVSPSLKKQFSISSYPEITPKVVSPTVKELKKQLSVKEDDKQKSSEKVKELKKQLSIASTQTDVDRKQEKVNIQSQNSIKDLKKQLSVETQTSDFSKRAEKKVSKIEIPNFGQTTTEFAPKSPKKVSPVRPSVLKVNSIDNNHDSSKKIRHPGANFTLPRKPTTTKYPTKSPVKPHPPPSPYKVKSFQFQQKENVSTFDKPTVASLQRQISSPQKKEAFVEKRTQVSFSKELSNAKNSHQEVVKTTKIVTTKTDLYFNDINLANVKLEINTETDNVIKVVPKRAY